MPFSIFMIFIKAPFGHHFRVAGCPKPTPPNSDLRPGADPAFHETIVMTVPFGPSVLFKNNFVDNDWFIFPVFSDFVCAMFYIQLVSQLLIIPQ